MVSLFKFGDSGDPVKIAETKFGDDWLFFRSFGKCSVAIHVAHPSAMHAACREGYSRGTRIWKQTLLAPFSQTSIFRPAWDWFFLSEFRSRQLTRVMARYWWLRQGWESHMNAFFWSQRWKGAIPNIDWVFQASSEKSTRSKPCQAKKVPKKSTESNVSCMIKRLRCPEPRTQDVILQSVYSKQWASWHSCRKKSFIEIFTPFMVSEIIVANWVCTYG